MNLLNTTYKKAVISYVQPLSIAPIGAIAGTTKTAINLNYVIIGLVAVVIILVFFTMIGNKK